MTDSSQAGLYAGTSECYRAHIQPEESLIENERKAAWGGLLKYMVPVTALPIAAYASIPMFVTNPEMSLMAQTNVVQSGVTIWGAFGLFKMVKLMQSFQSQLTGLVFKAASQQYGAVDYQHKPRGKFDIYGFEDHGLIRPPDEADILDLIEGQYKNTDFQMAKVTLYRQVRRKKEMSFRGLLMRFFMENEVHAPIRLEPKRNAITSKIKQHQHGKDGFHPMYVSGVNGEEFSKYYTVYAKDSTEAEKVLDEAMQQNLIELARAHKKKGYAMSFEGRELLVAIPENISLVTRHNTLGMLDMFMPAHKTMQKNVEKLLQRITIPHRIIDYLDGERPGRLVG